VHQQFNKTEHEREIIELSDGGLLSLDWYFCPNGTVGNNKKDLDKETSERPLCVVVPGLTGDASKMYMISLIKAACQNGYDFVCVNYRGMGGVPLKVICSF
jgi:predicted alpha/beta-fold hydrolase